MQVNGKSTWLWIALIAATATSLMLYPDIPLDVLKEEYANEAPQYIDSMGNRGTTKMRGQEYL